MCTHTVVSFYEREKKLLQFKSKEIMCAITCDHTHTSFSPDAHKSRASKIKSSQQKQHEERKKNILQYKLNEASLKSRWNWAIEKIILSKSVQQRSI